MEKYHVVCISLMSARSMMEFGSLEFLARTWKALNFRDTYSLRVLYSRVQRWNVHRCLYRNPIHLGQVTSPLTLEEPTLLLMGEDGFRFSPPLLQATCLQILLMRADATSACRNARR
jgi:hypothetical protein